MACDYNRQGVGFPGNCGPTQLEEGQWSSSLAEMQIMGAQPAVQLDGRLGLPLPTLDQPHLVEGPGDHVRVARRLEHRDRRVERLPGVVERFELGVNGGQTHAGARTLQVLLAETGDRLGV